jgi:hypothetical protein
MPDELQPEGSGMLAAVLLLVGGVLILIGSVMFIVNAFKVSVAWGLGVLFLAPVGLVFLVKNWRESKMSFLLSLAGGALVIVGVLLGQPVAAQ